MEPDDVGEIRAELDGVERLAREAGLVSDLIRTLRICRSLQAPPVS
jgi:hypothetical protein